MFFIRFLHRVLAARHYWRVAPFQEIAELYATRMLRSIAINMSSIFIAVYMFQNNFTITAILWILGLYFVFRAVASFPSALVIGSIGPKRSILLSNILYVLALIPLPFIGDAPLLSVGVFFVLQAVSVDLYAIAYDVNFSRAKQPDHLGKELGYMHIVEKIGAGIAPLAGGLIAWAFGAQWTMIVGAVLFLLAASPLFASPDKEKLHQAITFRGMPLRRMWRGLVASAGQGADFVVSNGIWSLYLAALVFASAGAAVYAEIGGLMTLTILASVVTSWLYGRLIDRHQGRLLMEVSTTFNSLLHFVRPFVTTPLSAGFVNVSNELVTSGYQMPLLVRQYDTADSLPGFRVAYLALTYACLALVAGILCLTGAGLCTIFGEIAGLRILFILAGIFAFPIIVAAPKLRSGFLNKN